ncbi:MAG TPA: ABC transporter permease [Jatrophihabitantaceae bacterium]|jgi:molybdate transport system permease protein|nr:ABC transporter permease [Jatrophihabitantaceae bacterium]
MKRRWAVADRSGTPVALIPPAAIGAMFFVVPALALLIRAPWSSLGAIYRKYQFWDALQISIVTSLEVTVISLLVGTPLAWILARRTFPAKSLVRAIVTLPLVLPPVVGGVAMFYAFGRTGVIGRYLQDWFGIDLAFTQFGVVLAETFVAMPFLIITLEGAFRSSDRGLEEAAATLGASRLRVLTRVTLPLIVPSLGAGAVLCWARAIGEYGATQLFGGNTAGKTQTMPTLIGTAFTTSGDPQAATALSLPLVLIAIVVLVVLRDRWLRSAPAS